MLYEILYVCSTNRNNRRYVSQVVEANTESTAITIGRERLFDTHGFTSVRKKRVQPVHQYRAERIRPKTEEAEEHAVYLLAKNPTMSHGLAIHLAAAKHRPEDINLIAYRNLLANNIKRNRGI